MKKLLLIWFLFNALLRANCHEGSTVFCNCKKIIEEIDIHLNNNDLSNIVAQYYCRAVIDDLFLTIKVLSNPSGLPLKTLKELLESRKVDANARDYGNATPLMMAAYENNIKAVELLLENGAFVNPKNIPPSCCPSPLYWAIHHNNIQMCKLLLQHGADLNWKDCDGKNYRTYPSEKKYKEIFKLLIDEEEKRA